MFSIKRFLPKPVREFIDKRERQQSDPPLWVALFFGFVGLYFLVSLLVFFVHAEAATLKVVAIESRHDDGDEIYRPVFEVTGDENQKLRNSGRFWANIRIHDVNEIVSGRVRWETGEIRSNRIMTVELLLGLLFLWISISTFHKRRSALHDGSWLPWNKG